MEFLNEHPLTNLEAVYREFGMETRSERRRLMRMLDDLALAGEVKFERENGRIETAAAASETDAGELAEKKPIKKREKSRDSRRKSDARPEAAPKPGKDGREPRIKIRNDPDDPMGDVIRVIEKYEIRSEFPPAVIREAEEIPSEIPDSEIARREDLRNVFVVTIDGADAKDLDDAVSIRKIAHGWELGVHIADVSYYAAPGSKLDREANKRANSFYFINKVIPMFPKNLSNGICSLNPQEDRLTLSVFMEIDPDGRVGKYRLAESVIHSNHRLTYDWVQAFLDGNEETTDSALAENLREMNVLFRVLHRRRLSDGGIDFDFQEQKCRLDDNDEPVKLWLKDRQDSERLVEEFMLIANQTVAKFLGGRGDALYRTHGEPDPEKMDGFLRIALKFGHKVYGYPLPDPRELQKILDESKGHSHAVLVNQVLLRSMQQARYTTENIGHYGLGFEFYTHYTSPIRRYADLVVHRLIKSALAGKKPSAVYTRGEMDEIADHISKVERVAVESERELYKIKAIRFMESKVRQRFSGVITGVTEFGIFVQIKLFGVEGLVRYQDLEDDYYEFDPANYCAVGRRKRKTYTMGDPVRIRVKRVNVEKGFLDLVLDGEETPEGEAPGVEV
jgi:ribonuclease R